MKVMAKMMVIALVLALGAVACGDDDDNGNNGANNGGNNGAPSFSTGTEIQTYLSGKTFVMEGEDIPENPLGFPEDMNLGENTQCFHSTTLEFTDTGVNVETQPASLDGAPNQGDVGDCDNDTPAGDTLSFTSNNVSISNVEDNGDCFDVDIAYTGFSQEGRGSISDDGTTLELELFGQGQVGEAQHRCETAGVGENDITITISGGATMDVPAGTAVQTYQLQSE